MKKHLWVILLCFISRFSMYAQRHEVGAFLGGSNLIGDIGRTNYIAPNSPVFGILYRYNLNPRYSIRLHLMGAGIRGVDREASEKYRKNRGRSIQSNLGEASALFEFNFFDFNDTHKTQSTPFIFAGIGLVGYQDKMYLLNYRLRRAPNGAPIEPRSPADFEMTDTPKDTVRLSYAIPFGLGYKYKFLYNWVITAEIGVRATGAKTIDHNAPNIREIIEKDLRQDDYQGEIRKRSRDFLAKKTFGDVRSRDWYVFSGLSLTYTFGRPPCYCD